MPISVGSVEVDILPNTSGIYRRLKEGLVPEATKAGEDAGKAAGEAFGPAMAAAVDNSVATAIGERIGEQIAARIVAQIRTSLSQGINQGGAAARPAATRQGDDTAGAFARAMRARLTEAFRSMPRLDISISDTGVDAELARLRARMETLSNKRIGVDVDIAAADVEVADISERLQRLGAAHPNVAIRADVAQARAALAEVRAEIDRISARPGQVRLETDGSFGARLRASVQAAEAALPNINIDANTSEADAQIASLRAQLTALRDQRVGIDIDAAAAQAKVDEIRTRLIALGASSPNIAVKVDTAAAVASLAQVEAMARAVDGEDVNMHVNVSNREALSAILQVSIALAALTAIPAIPVLAAGTGSLVAAFTAAGVGVGAFAAAAIPAVTQIKNVLDAQKQATQAAATETAKGGQVAAQAASRALQLAGAQASLASAERNGAKQIAQAQQQVAQAKQGVADAIQQAAQRQQQAEKQVASAERDLTTAQQAQRQAQLDLIAARKTAAEQLVDLNNQQKDAVLALRQAQQANSAAQKQLAADKKAGSKVTADQLAADQLAADQAAQALVEQQIATKRITDQTAAANKAGVKGSSTYKQAQDALAQAQQAVADKTQALKDARTAEAQTEVQNARSIADAQAKVAQAERGVADAQASAAESIASAQRQIQSAQLSAAGASNTAATAQAKYQAQLAKLSPSARDTFNAFTSLRSAAKAWSTALQPDIMPIFTRALDGIKNSLPGLTPIVKGAARGLGDLEDTVSRGFKTPWWQQMKQDFAGEVEPAIIRIGRIFGNIFVGMAGIVDAFLPRLLGVSNQTDGITTKFANFGRNLKTNPKFDSFLKYAADESPKLGDAFGKIGTALLDWSKAVAPLSGPMLTIIGAMASGVSAIATNAPGALQLIYGIFVATKLATLAQLAMNGVLLAYRAGVVLTTLVTEGWTAAQLAADAAFDANPIVAIILIIIVTIGLMVAAILYAWNHWAWFRDSVKAVWKAIQIAVKATIDWFAGPFADFFTKTIPGIFWALIGWVRANWPLILGIITGPIGLAVWAIQHYWGQIEGAFRDGWNWVKSHVLNPMRDFFTVTVPGWAGTLKDKVTGFFKDMATGVGVQWKAIEDATKKPINFVINTVWNNGILGVWKKITGWIPGLPKLGKIPQLAAGGTLPVTPGVFNRPTAIVGEGNPKHPEYVIPTDPKFRARALGLWRQAGAQMLFGGGIIGDIGDTVGGAAKKVGSAVAGAGSAAWSGIKTASQFLKDPVGNLVKLLDPIMRKVGGHFGDTAWGKMAAAIPKQAIEGLKHLVGIGGGSGPSKNWTPSSGVAQWAPTILQALALLGQPPSWLTTVERRMNQESGGNPSIVNKWDPNWLRGTPSVGLMQVIGPTFRSYAGLYKSRGPFSYGVSTDPLANIYAGLNYALHRYGSLSALNRAGGYDSGGYLQPGLNLAYNGTGRPEPVFTTQQANALTTLAARGGGGPASFHGDLYLEGGEFLGKVRGTAQDVYDAGQNELIQVLGGGRRI